MKLDKQEETKEGEEVEAKEGKSIDEEFAALFPGVEVEEDDELWFV